MGTKAIATAPVHEVGVIFQVESVRAILAGQKTMTRRPRGIEPGKLRVRLPYEVKSDLPRVIAPRAAGRGIHPAEINPHGAVAVRTTAGELLGVKPGEFDFVCPYAEGTTRLVDGVWHIEPHGDQRLWVREAFGTATGNGHRTVYRADLGTARWPKNVESDGARFSPSIFMPRWASRLVLQVTEVRVERLQSISCADITAEGIACPEHDFAGGFCTSECPSLRRAWAEGWDRINGERGDWKSNPWVFAIDFRRLQ